MTWSPRSLSRNGRTWVMNRGSTWTLSICKSSSNKSKNLFRQYTILISQRLQLQLQRRLQQLLYRLQEQLLQSLRNGCIHTYSSCKKIVHRSELIIQGSHSKSWWESLQKPGPLAPQNKRQSMRPCLLKINWDKSVRCKNMSWHWNLVPSVKEYLKRARALRRASSLVLSTNLSKKEWPKWDQVDWCLELTCQELVCNWVIYSSHSYCQSILYCSSKTKWSTYCSVNSKTKQVSTIKH